MSTESQKPGADEEYCSSCGAVIKQQAEMCPDCGVRQGGGTAGGPDRTTAAILAILLGGLGAHHFYLGNTVRAILYILFIWTLIPARLGLIEGIIYLTKSDQEFQAQYA